MIDFRSVTLELEVQRTSAEPSVEGGHFAGTFSQQGVLAGFKTLNLPTEVRRADVAIQSFHFETKDDHNIRKLKLVPSVRIVDGGVIVGAEASFADNSPADDFQGNRPFIMTTSVLVIVDRA